MSLLGGGSGGGGGGGGEGSTATGDTTAGNSVVVVDPQPSSSKPVRSSRLFSAPPSLSSGALASLARAPLMRMDTEVNASNQSLPNRNSTSEGNTPLGESSSTVLGPNGTLVPKSSILLNPSGKKTFIEQWRPKGEDEAVRPAPAVLRIAAIPTAKDREKQRERERIEREREIEREVREKEQAERVWGIPKKAFYLGMGEVNFNAQMAMLGGWGNGSADMGPLQASSRRKSLPTRSKNGKARPESKAGGRKSDSSSLKKRPSSASGPPPSQPPPKTDEGADSDASSIDLEELAALNAIINTRRSMEAAQALAGGNIARPVPPLVRSIETQVSSEKGEEPTPIVADLNANLDVDEDPTAESEPRRIKFAPFPVAYSGVPPILSALQNGEEGDLDEVPLSGSYDDAEKVFLEDDESDSDDNMFDGDESYSRRWTSGKGGKWYLMGMPKSVFTAQYYRSLQRRSIGGPETGPPVGGELSSSPSSERKLQAPSTETPLANERRGRRSRRTTGSRASSVKSRSSSVGSIEDDERERRRQLLRASRPGGTGMLTLPDGTKIRARRVGERYSDNEDEDDQIVGRTSIGTDVEDVQTGDKRASDDEGGRESDSQRTDGASTPVKRRRRSTEQLSAEQNAKAAVNAVPHSPVQATEGLDTVGEAGVSARRMPKRPTTMPAGPVPLSATQAAEVRRRHEEEVGALAAEVLQNIAKAKKAKQQQEQQQQQQQHQQQQQQQDGKHDKGSSKGGVQQTPAIRHEKTHVTSSAQPSSELTAYVDRGRLKGRVMRSFTTDDSRQRKQNIDGVAHPASRDQSVLRDESASKGASTPSYDRPTTPIRKTAGSDGEVAKDDLADAVDTSLTTDLTNSVASVRTLRPGSQSALGDKLLMSPSKRSTSPEGPLDAAEEAVVGHVPAIVTTNLPDVSQDLPASPVRSKSYRQRLPGLPSPLDLPRRPDMRGYAVVPLPVKQLGRRPQKPREGNFWGDDAQIDSADASILPSEEEDDAAPVSTAYSRGDSDDEDSDMDADQLAEEERRTAVQKKRATTRAAGAELVSGLGHKPTPKSGTRSGRHRSTTTDQLRGARSRSSTSLARSFVGSEVGISTEYTNGIRIGPKTSRSSQYSNGATSFGSTRTADGGASTGKVRPSLSTSVLSTARDRKGNSVVRLHRRKDTWNDFDTSDEDDGNDATSMASLDAEAIDEEALDLSEGDDELWPPTLDNALGGVTPMSIRNASVVDPNSASATSSKFNRPNTVHRLSSSSSVMSSLSASKYDSPSAAKLALHAAKARALREKREKEAKERERQKALEQKATEDSIDYGWPKSLQGSSLY